MNTEINGTSSLISARAAMSSAATSEARVISGVLNMTISASMPGAVPRARAARPYCSAVELAIMSTGFPTLASGGSSDRKPAAVSSSSSGTTSPLVSQASAARMPGPPPFVRIATRRPRNRLCELSIVARSSISSIDSARITPAWRSTASTATSPPESAAVCDAAARVPAFVRPALTATTGTRVPTHRAIRVNHRGSGISSK